MSRGAAAQFGNRRLRISTVVGFCECGNELLGSINCWKFLDQRVKQDSPPVRMSNTQYLAVSRVHISFMLSLLRPLLRW